MTAGELLEIESFGVRVGVVYPPALADTVHRALPPDWRPPGPAAARGGELELEVRPSGYRLLAAGEAIIETEQRAIAVGALDAQIRAEIAFHSPEFIFVHAGVVALDGRALVLPGSSFAGKTTLVAALLEHGATYYSDEYAVLDEQGSVHPYAKPLSVRIAGTLESEDVPARGLGVDTGSAPAPVGLIAATSFRPGARWEPRRLSQGAAALALLSHTVPARKRPEQSLAHVSRAARGAIGLEGPRGEAAQAASELAAFAASEPSS